MLRHPQQDGRSNDTFIIKDLTVASDLSFAIVYENGFLPGWFAGDSFGCLDCNFQDETRVRATLIIPGC